MLSTIFKNKPIVDDISKEWIFDTFAWCTAQLNNDFFNKNSDLIVSKNIFPPQNIGSAEFTTETIFANTLKYTGMTAWPIKLVAADSFTQKPMPKMLCEKGINSAHRGVNNLSINLLNNQKSASSIEIPFHPSQLNQPEELIAYLVHNQASILLEQHSMDSPGRIENLAKTIDLVACFMGFGIIFANTAGQHEDDCGSPLLNKNSKFKRQAALTELETVYALAIFSAIKGSDIKKVKAELKTHLFKPFHKACKEVSLYLQQTDNPVHMLQTVNKAIAV